MITKDQWLSLRDYVTKRLETEESFSMSDRTMKEMFGFAPPFWQQMCAFANEIGVTYSAHTSWKTSDGEPVELRFEKRK